MQKLPCVRDVLFVSLALWSTGIGCGSSSPSADVGTEEGNGGGQTGGEGENQTGGAGEQNAGGGMANGAGGTSREGGSGGAIGAGGTGAAGEMGNGGTAMGGMGAIGGGTCPAAAPFDESDQDLVARCTRPLVAAVGNGLRRAFSYDGQAWFGDVWFPGSGDDQNEESHRDVAFGNGLVVIVGDGGILTSFDAGLTFVKKDTGRSLHNSAVVFFAGAFWVVGGGGVHTSADGMTWKSWKQDDALPGGLKASFGASDGTTDGKIAVFVSGSTYRIFNGQTWSQGSMGGARGDSIAYGKDRFAVVSGFANASGSSPNGTTWTAGSGDGGLRFDSIVWNGTQFFGSGSQFDTNAQTSTNGLTWTRHKMNNAIGAVTRLGTNYVGANAGTLYRSSDARVWTLPHKAAGDIRWGFTSMTTGQVLKTP